MDTGWEHPATDKYIRVDLERAIGPIEWIRPARTMVELIRHKGIFPSRIARFCTEQLKVVPFLDWLAATFDGPVINAMGMRAEESNARRKLGFCERHEWGYAWRPLIRWTTQQVIDLHARHGLRPNPLYLLGAERVGCWPCIFSGKLDVRLVAKHTPERIDEIRALEVELNRDYCGISRKWIVCPDCPEEGDCPTCSGAKRIHPPSDWRPSFFTLRDRASGGKHRVAFIDEVAAWALTSRGGRELELFHEDDRSGCMRWGMCDA
jgi:3'-phosphoadenosine 5'-phosphosulfate sulfotransferase (PAPS reductase)/FAD synthetase